MKIYISAEQFSEIVSRSTAMSQFEFDTWFIATYMRGKVLLPRESIELIVKEPIAVYRRGWTVKIEGITHDRNA